MSPGWAQVEPRLSPAWAQLSWAHPLGSFVGSFNARPACVCQFSTAALQPLESHENFKPWLNVGLIQKWAQVEPRLSPGWAQHEPSWAHPLGSLIRTSHSASKVKLTWNLQQRRKRKHFNQLPPVISRLHSCRRQSRVSLHNGTYGQCGCCQSSDPLWMLLHCSHLPFSDYSYLSAS